MRLGADPEVFISRPTSLLASCGKIGGTKTSPLQLPNMPIGFTIQEDNVAVEFGIPPASNEIDFIYSILSVQKFGLQYIREKTVNQRLKFSRLSCTIFPEKELKHPGALVFGCEPDFNAWTGQQNPFITSDPLLRSAGGHIHVETTLDKAKVIKAMDITIGLASLFLDNNGTQRRALYGKAGAMRPKPYGVEYRVPSNFWIFSDNLISSMWRRTQHALNLIEDGVSFSFLGKKVQDAINFNDLNAAEQLLNKFDCSMGSYEN